MGKKVMARKNKEQGSIATERGKLIICLYWEHPEDRFKQHRWKIRTGEKDTKENRRILTDRLKILNSKIKGGAFFPCQEFPGAKIAGYCRCSTCSIVTPMGNTAHAPKTLRELLTRFEEHEKARATGDKIIEYSTYEDKVKKMRAFEIAPLFDPGEGTDTYDQFPALADYQIFELTPDEVKPWLYAFQYRQQRLAKGDAANTTKYVNQLSALVKEALHYGQYKRWWKAHPLLEYGGNLMEATKEEKSRIINKTLHKPFTLVERDKIIEWYYRHWQECDSKINNGRRKLRRMFHYYYILIGFNTGMRSPSEMTALQWASINFSRNQIYVGSSREASGRLDRQIVRKYTKTIKHRWVDMNDIVIQAFRDLKAYRQEDQDWVFWNPMVTSENPLRAENGWAPLTGGNPIRRTFSKCLAALGISDNGTLGQYRMRHTFVTTVLDNTDLGDYEVATLIGDNVETMERHYKGYCIKRWQNSESRAKLNVINEIGKNKLRSVK
jgi:integrase